MSTFTNAVYDATKMGTPAPLTYSLSGTNNVITLSATGTYNSADVIGILYNDADLTAKPLSATPVFITAVGGTTTVIRLSGVPAGGATLALINANRFSTTFTVAPSTTSVTIHVSAGGFNNTGPNEKRLWNLNG